jgi:hypothetical protein
MNLIDLTTGAITESGLNASEINEVAWIPGSETGIIYINGTNEEIPGGVTIWVGDIKTPSMSKMVASLDAPYNGLKVANTSNGDMHFLVNCMAYPNGTAVNPETVVTPYTTARFYSDIYVRHWDTWLTKNRYNLFAGTFRPTTATRSLALACATSRKESTSPLLRLKLPSSHSATPATTTSAPMVQCTLSLARPLS